MAHSVKAWTPSETANPACANAKFSPTPGIASPTNLPTGPALLNLTIIPGAPTLYALLTVRNAVPAPGGPFATVGGCTPKNDWVPLPAPTNAQPTVREAAVKNAVIPRSTVIPIPSLRLLFGSCALNERGPLPHVPNSHPLEVGRPIAWFSAPLRPGYGTPNLSSQGAADGLGPRLPWNVGVGL